jgi:SAM-dependent methyltransferase
MTHPPSQAAAGVATGGRLAPCPVCQGLMSVWFERRGRAHLRCHRCRFIKVAEDGAGPRVPHSVYTGDGNVFFRDGNDRYYLDDINHVNARRKLRWVRRFVRDGGTLLDAGANFGYFLACAQEHFDTSGFDISREAVEWSRTRLGVRSRVGSVYDVGTDEPGVFDVVTAWDLIEHLSDPCAALVQLHRVLNAGGYLFLSTPDAGSLAARLLGSRWHYFDPEQHLSLFDRANLTTLLRDRGFQVVETRSFGHTYRVRYVLDRLRYLHQSRAVGLATAAAARALFFALDRHVHITLRDVMGVAARRL